MGMVITQDVNRITVQFPETQKTFILDKNYSSRPRFEDDEKTVSAFTEYGTIKGRMMSIQKELRLGAFDKKLKQNLGL